MWNLKIFVLSFVLVGISSLSEGKKAAEKCSFVKYKVCSKNATRKGTECYYASEVVDGYWDKSNLTSVWVSNLGITNLKKSCKVAMCEDVDLMGYCAQIRYADANEYRSRFRDIIESESLSLRCSCKSFGSWNTTIEDDPHFDRNYIGLVYSPYDKYWEPTGPNGTLVRVPWSISYGEDEIRTALELISTKFSYLSTSTYFTSDWYVPKVAADINLRLGYPALRVSVGMFHDPFNVFLKSKELNIAIDAAKLANRIFNGTVWGIVATSHYVHDVDSASDLIDKMKQVREISNSQQLRLQVGVRSDKCYEFIATRQPSEPPYYSQPKSPPRYNSSDRHHDSLQYIANNSDFLLCTFIPMPQDSRYPFPDMISLMQKEFVQVRDALRRINPKLKLVIETGVPSNGTSNGFDNSVYKLEMFWHKMAEFAKEEGIPFHMLEAIDQPWKNVEDWSGSNRVNVNGPIRADGYYGYWKRVNNSVPPVYIEKIAQKGLSDQVKSKENYNGSTVLAMMGNFFGFIKFTMFLTVLTGYLWLKLRNAKRQTISPACISQFMSGGDDVDKNDSYAVGLRIPYDRKYELTNESFHIDKSAVMGSGQCGIVCRGAIKGLTGPVAFKCTSPSSTVLDIKSLMSEIKILSYIGEHQNVLCILGAYTKKIERGIVYLALEYCPLGSLERFLRKADTKKLDIKYAVMAYNCDYVDGVLNTGYETDFDSDSSGGRSFVSTYSKNCGIATTSLTQAKPIVDLDLFHKWSYQIASAMEYVSQKNVVHADLAARNILLVGLDHVKVCDFGLSRKLYQEIGIVHDKDTPLPWRWMSPESLKHLTFSVETDVWAFGVTVWEIFSLAEVPYHGLTYDMSFTRELEKGAITLSQAKYAPDETHKVLLKCWDRIPLNRPSFTSLKEFFHERNA